MLKVFKDVIDLMILLSKVADWKAFEFNNLQYSYNMDVFLHFYHCFSKKI
jgi:hypothetical protein